MGFLRRLWHRLLFGLSQPATQPRPAARPAAPARPASPRSTAAFDSAADMNAIAATIHEWIKPRPPRCVYRSREEIELALLLAWLPDAERRRFLDLLLPKAGNHDPWTIDDVEGEPWQQCQKWAEPLVINEPETMTSEGFCSLLETQIKNGLYTYCTPLSLLSRPVRMLWLLRQGRHAEQVYAALAAALGSQQQALEYARSVIAGL